MQGKKSLPSFCGSLQNFSGPELLLLNSSSPFKVLVLCQYGSYFSLPQGKYKQRNVLLEEVPLELYLTITIFQLNQQGIIHEVIVVGNNVVMLQAVPE